VTSKQLIEDFGESLKKHVISTIRHAIWMIKKSRVTIRKVKLTVKILALRIVDRRITQWLLTETFLSA
jgi:hypothetical protein